MEVFKVSSKTGAGMPNFLEFLENRRIRSQVATAR
jgi:hypothetical protein